MPQEGRFAGLYDLLFSNLLLKKIQENVVKIAMMHDCNRFIDIGCGTGMQLALLKNNGIDAIGIDVSPLMIKSAKKKNVDCILGNAIRTAFPSGYFDCLNISFVLHPNKQEDREKIIEEMKRIAKKNGIFIITDYGVPKRKFASVVINSIERMATKEHNINYRDFIKRGALEGLIKEKMRIIESCKFFNGAVETIVAISG